MTEIKGKKIADISKWQGKPDYSRLKDAVDALIIRVQDGSRREDSVHKYNEAMAKQYGIPFSSYAFGRYVSVNDAIVEADDFMKRADKESRVLFLDAEKVTTKDPDDYFEATQTFINRLKEKSGKPVGLYSGSNFYKEHHFDKLKNVDIVWIADYDDNDGTMNTPPDVPCDVWQYTSKGRVSGINGDVDLSVTMTQKGADLLVGKPVSKPKPAAKPKEKDEVHYITHKVKKGDTLWDIAKQYKASFSEVVKANKKYADLLPIGVTVKVPIHGPAPKPKKHTPTLPKGILMKGSKGQAVEDLQYFLKKLNFIPHGSKPGVYDEGTYDAVRRFQMVYLPYEVDGIYGPHTRAEMLKHL